MSYQIIPGVRQRTLYGERRLYQLARYPSGKIIEVPYIIEGASPALMIPVTKPQPQRRRLQPSFGAVGRRMQVEFRVHGEQETRTLQDTSEIVQAFIDQHRALCGTVINKQTGQPEMDLDRYGNCASYERHSDWDWFVQYIAVEEA